ncbi:MAG: hypothetical protein ACK5M4_10410 [Pseudorhodobacter sp.]
MTLPGAAFLAMWHDITPAMQTEYMEWHTREHMPERLSIPGFLLGKRLIDENATRYRYGTVYCGRDLEIFRSPAYLERLNNPTKWSGHVQPGFRNFLRVACEKIASAGHGDGGVMATIRLDLTPGMESTLRGGAQGLCETVQHVPGVSAVHLGLAQNEVSDIRTRETEMRPGMVEEGFDAVLLIEGSEKSVLDNALVKFEHAVSETGLGLHHPRSNIYRLAYQLGVGDLRRG